MGKYSHPDIKPGGLLENLTYPYSRANAEALLDAGGFPVNSSTGWRFWDRNGNGNEELNEYLELRFVVRKEHAERFAFANFLIDELNAVKLRVKAIYPSWIWNPMLEKDFHLHTGGWGLGIDPDHLILWNWDYYWHPGFCYNYAGCNNQTFNELSEAVAHAITQDEALTNAHLAQRVFAEQVMSVTLWSTTYSKAMSRLYTGGNKWQNVTLDDGENKYRGQYWNGAVNKPAYGIDNFFTFINMHPQRHERGENENMTIRWGFKVPEIKQLNPVYSSWLWDWNVLDLIYESLLMRNPNDLWEFIPWLAGSYDVGTYLHPIHGNCTKVMFTLRPEATWHDGTPLTTADVYFTFVELQRILSDRGLPNPWWWSSIQDVLDFKILDPYNFEVLLSVRDYFALSNMGGTPILPKHIWKPIAETGPIQEFAPDPNMIGTGPWRFQEYVENSRVLLVANGIESTVQTNLPGSTPIISSKGYYRYHPVTAEARVDGTTGVKIDYYTNHTMNYTINNLHDETITIDINITYPDGTEYGETGIAIQATGNWTHSWTGDIKHMDTTSILINVFSPWEFRGLYYWSQIYYGTLISYGIGYRSSTDIVGSTYYDDIGLGDYPFKWQLPTPDIKIDIKDIAQAAIAFGSYPGHRSGIPGGSRWNMGVADINNDYRIDIRDVAMIAKQFGWTG